MTMKEVKNKIKINKPLIIYLPGAISTCSNKILALFKSLWIIPSSWIDAIPAEISLLKQKKKGFVDFVFVLKEKKKKRTEKNRKGRKKLLCKFHCK